MASATSLIAAAALTLGASASVYGYVVRASHSHAESICSREEYSLNHGNNSKRTRVQQEGVNQMTRAGNFAPGSAPQFDGLNFFETIIIPAQMYRL